MCGPGADETPHGLRIFQGAWADGYIGRHPVRPGYAYVIWKGRHVAEPTELTAEETAGFWSEVARVAGRGGVPAGEDELVQPWQRPPAPARPPGAAPAR